jgi:hypothetical protein
MRAGLALLGLLLGLAAPAGALTLHDVVLRCASVVLAPTPLVTNVTCEGQGLWLTARVSGFPVPQAPTVEWALVLDGVLAATETRTLPADLGPIVGATDGQHYDTLGMGWRLPLDGCCAGRVVPAVARVAIGPDAPALAFTLVEPTPEPATLLLVATTAGLLGWRWGRR